MKISVIGCGYLGAVHAASMAELGHEVVGIDVDHDRVEVLSRGSAPFHEEGLAELLEKHVATGRLRFSTDYAQVAAAEVHFICVGTPQLDGSYAADVSYVDAALSSLLPHLGAGKRPKTLIVGKSTVTVGTASRLASLLPEDALLLWNPEFL